MHPTRRVRVVGFDKEIATKNNLPIVTAVTIVDVPKHGPVLLQVNEAVLNESADHSLMSTYQMSEFGIPLDACPARHVRSQSMMLDDVEFKFKWRHCMVSFVHRAPTKK